MSEGASGAANGTAFYAVVSGDGRFVAFESDADNLVPGDTNDAWDIFVKDLQTGAIERVSVNDTGLEGTGPSTWAAISDDGRFVAFHSRAGNFGAPVNTRTIGNQTYTWSATHVYVRDRVASTTTWVSHQDGTPLAASGDRIHMSGNGRFVSFTSGGVGENDTNGRHDMYVHDRNTGTTFMGSLGTNGTQFAHNSHVGGVSNDGDRMTWWVDGGGPNLNGRQVMWRDVSDDVTQNLHHCPDCEELHPEISDDGSFVAYKAWNGDVDNFEHGRLVGVNLDTGTAIVHLPSVQLYGQMKVDASGARVAFPSHGAAWMGTGAPVQGIYLWHVGADTFELVSLNDMGAPDPNVAQGFPDLSDDGMRIAWDTITPLEVEDGDATSDVYVRVKSSY